jgi:autotransporter-associated beta strand protein
MMTNVMSELTITLNGDKTVSTLAFDNANAYTIAPATTETLFLDNTANAGQAQIIGTSGSHVISAPVSLTSNTVASVANSVDTISLNGIVSGAGSLSKSGPGTLHLGAVNTYSGGTTIGNGTLSFATGGISTTGPISISTSTLRWATGNTDDLSLAPLVSLPAGNAIFDTNGNDVAFTAGIGDNGAGNLVKAGAGKLSLAAGNSYGGTTSIDAGTLSIAVDSSLGPVPGTATPGEITIGNATLQSTANLTVAANRGITLTSATSAIDAASGSTLTYNGIIAGSGKLNLTGNINLGGANTHSGGTVINTGALINLSGANTYTGGTVIEAGALVTLNSGTALGTGQTELRDSQLTINVATTTFNNIFVASGKTGTIDGGVQIRPGVSGLSGGGDVTFLTRSGGTNSGNNAFGFRFQGSYSGFNGSLFLKSAVSSSVNSFVLHFNSGGFSGDLTNATIILSDNARLCGNNNSAGNTVNIGALAGDNTTFLAGADYAGSQTYNIGAKNLDTTFDGLITNGNGGNANLIKSGTGKLTLTGANTYLGTTAIAAGTLAITNASGLGADTTGTTINGGDVNGNLALSGSLVLTEPLTLGGRQGLNFESAHIVNVSGNNQLTAAAITLATGGNSYNFQSDAGLLSISGSFIPSGAVTGARYLQLFGEGNGEWLGNIQNGSAAISLNKNGTGTWTLSGALS